MKLTKDGGAWSFANYKDETGRFLFKNIHNFYSEKDNRYYCLSASKCGFELYDNGEKVGFFKTLKAAKAVAESRM